MVIGSANSKLFSQTLMVLMCYNTLIQFGCQPSAISRESYKRTDGKTKRDPHRAEQKGSIRPHYQQIV